VNDQSAEFLGRRRAFHNATNNWSGHITRPPHSPAESPPGQHTRCGISALRDAYPRPCDFVCWSSSSAARTKSGAASDQSSSRQKTSTVELSGDATKCALACAPSIAPYGTELFDPFGRRTSARPSLSSMNVATTRHNCPGSTAATLSWAASARLPIQHRQRDPRHVSKTG
jgi:hypothetical protein